MSKNTDDVLLFIPQQNKINQALNLLNDAQILHRTQGEEGKRSIGVAAADMYEAMELLEGIGVGVNNEYVRDTTVFIIKEILDVSNEGLQVVNCCSILGVDCWVLSAGGILDVWVCVRNENAEIVKGVFAKLNIGYKIKEW